MTLDIPGVRPAWISEELALRLEEFLRFRHFIRHSYGFQLSYRRLEPLWQQFETVLTDFRHACSFLIDFLKSLAS